MNKLPPELYAHILGYLPDQTGNAHLVCRAFHALLPPSDYALAAACFDHKLATELSASKSRGRRSHSIKCLWAPYWSAPADLELDGGFLEVLYCGLTGGQRWSVKHQGEATPASLAVALGREEGDITEKALRAAQYRYRVHLDSRGSKASQQKDEGLGELCTCQTG